MNKIYPVTIETIPFSKEKFSEILEQIHDKHSEELENLEEEVEVCKEHIFHNTSNEKEVRGFSMAVCFKRIEDKIFCNVEQIILYDTEDEWFEEYKRIKNQ